MHWVWVILGALVVTILALVVGLIVDAISKRREKPKPRRWIAVLVCVTVVLAVTQGLLQLASEATLPEKAAPVVAPSGLTQSPSTTRPPGTTPLHGWGPSRTTYSADHPAGQPTLNSIIDNPTLGDERNFLTIKPAGAPGAEYTDLLAVSPGDTVDVVATVSNDAADNLGSKGTIHGLTAELVADRTGTNVPISVILQGTNVPKQWDGAAVLSESPVRLEWVDGSAIYHNVYGKLSVPDEMGSGAEQFLGSDQLDGEVRIGIGGPKNQEIGTGYLTFQLKVVASSA